MPINKYPRAVTAVVKRHDPWHHSQVPCGVPGGAHGTHYGWLPVRLSTEDLYELEKDIPGGVYSSGVTEGERFAL